MGSMGALTPSNLEMHQDLLRGSLPRHGEAPVGAAMAGPPGQFMNLLLPVQPKPAVRLSNEERLSRMYVAEPPAPHRRAPSVVPGRARRASLRSLR